MGYYAAGDYYAGDPGRVRAAVAGKGKPGLLSRIGGRFKKDPGLPGLKRLGKAGLKKVKGLQDPFGLGVPGAGARRHRRMNVLNPRALRKALRRAEGFTRFAKRIVHITMPKKHVHGFRFRRRKKRA
jgi:hypothetical protein